MGCCEAHSCPRMVILLVTFCVFLADLIITILSFLDVDKVDLFSSTPLELMETYELDFSPVDWLQYMWAPVYFLQLLWMVYSLSTLCTKTDDKYLYFNPGHICSTVYIFYSLGLGAHIAYMIMFDMAELEISLGLIMGTCLFMYLAILVLMHGIHTKSGQLVKLGQRSAIVNSILFGCNFIAAYAAWATVMTLFIFGIYLQEFRAWDSSLVATICLSIFIFELFVYVLLDFVFCESHFRYVYTPYMVVGVTLASIFYQNWDLEESMTIILLCLIAIDAFALLSKFVMSGVQSQMSPIHVSADESREDEDSKPVV